VNDVTTGFVKVVCLKCKGKQEQMVFARPAMEVKCLVCGETLATPTGGKAKLFSRPDENEPASAGKPIVKDEAARKEETKTEAKGAVRAAKKEKAA
jgi:small subunit ribosomal protein S27e